MRGRTDEVIHAALELVQSRLYQDMHPENPHGSDDIELREENLHEACRILIEDDLTAKMAKAMDLPEDTSTERVLQYLDQVVRVAKTHFGMPLPVWENPAMDAVQRRVEELERIKFQDMDPTERLRKMRPMGFRPMPKKIPDNIHLEIEERDLFTVPPLVAKDLAPQCQICKHWHFPGQPCMSVERDFFTEPHPQAHTIEQSEEKD